MVAHAHVTAVNKYAVIAVAAVAAVVIPATIPFRIQTYYFKPLTKFRTTQQAN